jgi:hypothetical protein
MGFMNKRDKVMTQNLTQSLVNHRHVGLAAETVPKLPLHHAEGRFDVRALVVVLQKLGLSKLKVVVHLPPGFATNPDAIGLESDKGSAAQLVIKSVFFREP